MTRASIVLISALPLLLPEVANACSCVHPGNILQRRSESEITIYGEVIGNTADSANRLLQTIKVLKDYSSTKVVGDTVVLHGLATVAPAPYSSCADEFAVGTHVVIFASSGPDYISTHSCRFNLRNVQPAHLDSLDQAVGTAVAPKRAKPGLVKRYFNLYHLVTGRQLP